MYLNESINVKDSAIFMGFMRQALVENLKEKGADESAIKFITEDAKDCEVLSLAMYGKMCPSDDPTLAETYLLSNLKDFIVENVNDLAFDSDYTPSQFIHEIGGLSLVDTDSMTMIQEGFVLNEGVVDAVKKGIEHYNRQKIANTQGFEPTDGSGDEGAKWGKYFRNSGPGAASDKRVTSPSEDSKPGWENTTNANTPAQDNPTQQGRMGLDSVMYNIRKWAGQAGEGVSKAWSGFTKFVNDHTGGNAKAVGVTALVGLAAFLGYKAYQRYFSQAAKQCAGKSGAERSECIVQAKKSAIKQQMAMLKRSMSGCKASANPNKCRQDITQKLSKLQAKL